jgi:hypothetical protein
MNGYQENVLSMLKAFIALCEKYIAIIMGIPALHDAYTRLKTTVTNIENTVQNQIKITSGIAADKQAIREKLALTGSTIAQALMSVGASTNNLELRDSMQYTEYGINKLRDELVKEVCNTILLTANTYPGELSARGIDGLMIAEFQNLITKWNDKAEQPTVAIASRAAYTQQLKELFSEASYILREEIDRNMHVLKINHREFYLSARNARNIINLGRHRKVNVESDDAAYITGIITDEITGEPLEDVKVSVKESGFVTFTDPDGQYEIDKVNLGECTIVIEYEGYVMKTLPKLNIESGDEVEEDILLRKIADESSDPSTTDDNIISE